MLERPQFHIETVETGLNYGRYRAEPMEPGYGTTLGNALRRIMLRSLEGVAVSRIRLDNVWHEFSTIPHVREDVTEVVLNLKRVRLKRMIDVNGEARAHLYVRGDAAGDRVVTAGDVVWPAEVDVINPDQVRAQVEGNIVWAIGMTLHEKLTIEQSRLKQGDFSQYLIPRYSDAPQMHVALVDEGDAPSGAGETAIVAVPAAITNAIAGMTGAPVVRLPWSARARA